MESKIIGDIKEGIIIPKKRGPCIHGKSRCRPCKKGYCEHDTQTNRCKLCGGASICDHGNRRSRCVECGGGEICEHKKLKMNCVPCGGSQICEHKVNKQKCGKCRGNAYCEHDKIKEFCRKCGGSRICIHDKIKSSCVPCGGSQICIHKVDKSKCGKCRGSAYCDHAKIKNQCVECEGSRICIHKIRKSRCLECDGSEICEHGKVKYVCIDCDGSALCIHKKVKNRCKECGGSTLCKSSWCETTGNKRYEGYCFHCYIHLFPDKPTTRNYKTKEISVKEYLYKTFPEIDWIHDESIKNLQGGCHNKRPDFLIDLGYLVIIIEIDEHQHRAYETTCENSRMMQISEDIGHRPLTMIRFNPDSYTNKKGEFINDTWKLGKDGLLHLTEDDAWENRLHTLSTYIDTWLEKPEDTELKTIELVKLYYDNFI
jgi:hypothetical protein